MNNLLTRASFSLLVTSIVSVGISSISYARDASIEPESLPGNYGLVRSYNGQNLDIRLLDGTEKSYTISPGISVTPKQGDLVIFDVDDAGMVSELQPPAVDEVIRGTVTEIDMESQTVTLLAEGADASVDTRISQRTISKLGLEPGKEIMVTKYANTWASKVCLPKAAVPPVASPPVQDPPVPTGGIEEPDPILVDPIPALW